METRSRVSLCLNGPGVYRSDLFLFCYVEVWFICWGTCITHWMDYCTAPPSGLPQKATDQLQLIQHAAFCVLTRTKQK